MRFVLVDRIEELEPGKEITVTKNLSLAEEYLADHFPTFPVLPGVLILQVAIEAASWLVRVSSDFAHSMVVLREARQVRYGSFVSPGECLRVKVKAKRIERTSSAFQAVGNCEGVRTLQANLELSHFSLAEKDPRAAVVDANVVAQLREQYRLISGQISK